MKSVQQSGWGHFSTHNIQSQSLKVSHDKWGPISNSCKHDSMKNNSIGTTAKIHFLHQY